MGVMEGFVRSCCDNVCVVKWFGYDFGGDKIGDMSYVSYKVGFYFVGDVLYMSIIDLFVVGWGVSDDNFGVVDGC